MEDGAKAAGEKMSCQKKSYLCTKNKVMATITFNYNARNVQARNLLNYIMASGLLVPKIEKDSSLAQAFEDIEKGRVYHAIRKGKSETEKRKTEQVNG